MLLQAKTRHILLVNSHGLYCSLRVHYNYSHKCRLQINTAAFIYVYIVPIAGFCKGFLCDNLYWHISWICINTCHVDQAHTSPLVLLILSFYGGGKIVSVC